MTRQQANKCSDNDNDNKTYRMNPLRDTVLTATALSGLRRHLQQQGQEQPSESIPWWQNGHVCFLGLFVISAIVVGFRLAFCEPQFYDSSDGHTEVDDEEEEDWLDKGMNSAEDDDIEKDSGGAPHADTEQRTPPH